MQEKSTTSAPLASIPLVNGTCILSGYGVKVSVRSHHLVCEDGVCEKRRAARLHRATSGLKHLVILASDGYISLAALQFLADIGAGLLVIGDEDVILAHAPSGCDYPHLRRAQALAPFTPLGFTLLRDLITAKIQGQAETLKEFTENSLLDGLAVAAAAAEDDNLLRTLESRAACLYWQAWQNIPLSFARKDLKHIPEHWRTFGPRASHLTGHPRNATTPGNALLNYAYAILKGETEIAIRIQGLDPGLGLLHTDQPSCQGLVYDLMEPARPAVDRYLLRFLQRQTFTKHDFWEDERGIVRISQDLRRQLTASAPEFRNSVKPWVEYMAKRLSEEGIAFSSSTSAHIPTLLTQENRSKGRDPYRTHDPTKKATPVPITRRCLGCGANLEGERTYCEACLPEVREAQTHAFVSRGLQVLSEARQGGEDPAHGGEAARKRASALAQRKAEREAWERENGSGETERTYFLSEVLPKLANIPVTRIAKETGLSLRYAALIRQGKVIPHPVHYDALRTLV